MTTSVYDLAGEALPQVWCEMVYIAVCGRQSVYRQTGLSLASPVILDGSGARSGGLYRIKAKLIPQDRPTVI
jgi:hypothetical protein